MKRTKNLLYLIVSITLVFALTLVLIIGTIYLCVSFSRNIDKKADEQQSQYVYEDPEVYYIGQEISRGGNVKGKSFILVDQETGINYIVIKYGYDEIEIIPRILTNGSYYKSDIPYENQ